MAAGQNKHKPAPAAPTAAPPAPPPAAAPEPEPQLPANLAGKAPMVIDYGEDEGAGAEGITAAELKIPIFRILQGLSPQCKPVQAGGVEGARPGMILNTATGELFNGEDGLGFIAAYREWNFVEYIPRDDGGGFVGIFDPNDALIVSLVEKYKKETGKPSLMGALNRFNNDIKKNTEIIETRYLYGIIGSPPEGMLVRGLIPFTSTQIPRAYQPFVQRFNDTMYPNSEGKLKRPPIFAHAYTLKTQFQSNKKGQFWGWLIQPANKSMLESRFRLDDQFYTLAGDFYRAIKAGEAKADYGADVKAGGPEADKAAGKEEEIPF